MTQPLPFLWRMAFADAEQVSGGDAHAAREEGP